MYKRQTETFYGASELAGASLADKKRSGSTITLVMPRAIGNCELLDIPVSDLQGIIEKGLCPIEAVSYTHLPAAKA